MSSAFAEVAKKMGRSLDEANELFGVLPATLQSLDAEMHGDRWYYTTPDTHFMELPQWAVAGSACLRPVETLYRLMVVVCEQFHHDDWRKIFSRMGTLTSHGDTLEEIIVVERIGQAARVKYEPDGDSSADLLIHLENQIPLLVEVKRRRQDTFNLFKQLHKNGFSEDRCVPPDPAWLFEKVLHKFPSSAPTERLQGVWSAVSTYHEPGSVRDYFESVVPSDKVHFAIVSFGEDKAYVVGRTDEIEGYIRSVFRLVGPNPPPPGDAAIGAFL